MARMIDPRKYFYYPGDDGKAEYLFETDLWIECQKQLATADTVMRMLALQYKVRFLSNINGSWPSRRLIKKDVFKIPEVRLMLNQNYLIDRNVYYELNFYVVANYLGMMKKQLEFSKLKKYSIEQVSDRLMLINDFENIVRSL